MIFGPADIARNATVANRLTMPHDQPCPPKSHSALTQKPEHPLADMATHTHFGMRVSAPIHALPSGQ